ncbi:hypothetical protein [Actinoplanes sp. URMC 104]|uniref:hypothetical protein n=1 Tax=Actinoplanes sp. URMC 104 TaxID=3423409 RepID=UPI003F1A96D9
MRWFRRRQQVTEDTGRGRALVEEVRTRFGAHLPATFRDQAESALPVLSGEDGLAASVAVLREFADAAYADLSAQAAARGHVADRRNYRPLWRAAGHELRWTLFALPCRLHPYIQVTAAAVAVGGQAKRAVRLTDPQPLLAHLFEILDLTVAGWEFARVRPDTDAATLAQRLIHAARDLRAAMSDEPPLPDPVRELMRRNNTVDVYDPDGPRVVGAFNPGREMRESLLA